jgi:hypothetical protein
MVQGARQVSIPKKILMWAIIGFLVLVLIKSPGLGAKLGHNLPHIISQAASSLGTFLANL